LQAGLLALSNGWNYIAANRGLIHPWRKLENAQVCLELNLASISGM
jgi:hypothetical protein